MEEKRFEKRNTFWPIFNYRDFFGNVFWKSNNSMVFASIFNLKNSQKGITLIEIIVVIFIITLFASIAFLNLPKIQGSFALSSAAYELAQKIRVAENDSVTGVGGASYVISFPDSKHYSVNAGSTQNIDRSNAGISIKEFDEANGTKINNIVSITFAPPNPIVSITGSSGSEVDIVLSLDSDSSQTKTVIVNTSGLIQVK